MTNPPPSYTTSWDTTIGTALNTPHDLDNQCCMFILCSYKH